MRETAINSPLAVSYTRTTGFTLAEGLIGGTPCTDRQRENTTKHRSLR
jgi:hypothetical protein